MTPPKLAKVELSLPNELEMVSYDRVADMLVHALLERGLIDVLDKAVAGSDVPWLKLAEAARSTSAAEAPHARARARQVVPISELVFGALTQNRSSLEDAPPRAVAIELRVGAGFRHEKSRQTP